MVFGKIRKSSLIFGGPRVSLCVSGLTADHYFWCSRVFLAVLRVFRGIMGCSGVLWDVPGVFQGCSGLFRAAPGVFQGCSGVFRGCSGGVPGCSGVFRCCSGFYRHPSNDDQYNKENYFHFEFFLICGNLRCFMPFPYKLLNVADVIIMHSVEQTV